MCPKPSLAWLRLSQVHGSSSLATVDPGLGRLPGTLTPTGLLACDESCMVLVSSARLWAQLPCRSHICRSSVTLACPGSPQRAGSLIRLVYGSLAADKKPPREGTGLPGPGALTPCRPVWGRCPTAWHSLPGLTAPEGIVGSGGGLGPAPIPVWMKGRVCFTKLPKAFCLRGNARVPGQWARPVTLSPSASPSAASVLLSFREGQEAGHTCGKGSAGPSRTE